MPAVRGITVVGCDPDSGEIPVAVAACLAARAAGERADPFVTAAIGPNGEADAGLVAELEGVPFVGHRERASPLIAAHHTGQAFEPTELVEAARIVGAERLLIAAAPGGLLAPLTEHYSNRDFARELGLPVVVAASAVGGVTGQVRLVAEAARTAGLRVAAVVLTGWPDPPSRIQLDERGLLTKVVRAGVLTLPASARTSSALAEAAARWPVAEWTTVDAAATPAAAEPEPEPAAPLVLDPYDAWTQHEVGDPRNTQRPQIMQTMLEIVAAEGPMTATRAYSLYNRAAGGRKLTSVAKAPLSSAVYWLAREGKLTLTREADIPWQGDDMIRLPDQPAVRIRELGPRTLDEVPLEEVAALVELIRAQRGNLDVTEMKRAILTAYGLVRLTSRADEYLGLAIDLAS
jgi:dethiobiotin synthetase